MSIDLLGLMGGNPSQSEGNDPIENKSTEAAVDLDVEAFKRASAYPNPGEEITNNAPNLQAAKLNVEAAEMLEKLIERRASAIAYEAGRREQVLADERYLNSNPQKISVVNNPTIE